MRLGGQVESQTDRKTGSQTGADRQIGRQTDIHTYRQTEAESK